MPYSSLGVPTLAACLEVGVRRPTFQWRRRGQFSPTTTLSTPIVAAKMLVHATANAKAFLAVPSCNYAHSRACVVFMVKSRLKYRHSPDAGCTTE